MDQQCAKEIIHCLADGIDPLTGEVLAPNHVCNQPDVIRALHIAEQALQKDLSRPEDGPWHKEYGKVWSQKEIDLLATLFDRQYTVAQMSKQLGRSESGVRAKLVRLGKIQNRRDAK